MQHGSVFNSEARRIREFLDDIPRYARRGEQALAGQAAAGLQQFAEGLARKGVPSAAIAPAKYALALLIDRRARRVPRVNTDCWLAASHGALFDHREIDGETIKRFRQTAHEAGPDYAELAGFLEEIVRELNAGRQRREGVSAKPAVFLGIGFAVLVASLAVYALVLDFRYHLRISTVFEANVSELPPVDDAEVGAHLDALAELRAQVARAIASAPLAGSFVPALWNSAARADAHYSREVVRLLPAAAHAAIDEALATEGDDLAIYDTLRAWSILAGRSDWSTAYLSGWFEARAETLGVGRLAAHVGALQGAELELAPIDDALWRQALVFAAAASEPDRAFLELTRLDALGELEPWSPTAAVPEVQDVLVRRSGAAIQKGVAPIYTLAGWRYARDIGAGVAVREARAAAAALFDEPPKPVNETPDLLLSRLQNQTLDVWSDWLTDLRVRPFHDQRTALHVTGALSQRNSPLERLLKEVWVQIGGRDRLRSHRLQLRIATRFGPMIQYVEEGRIRELTDLFATLNVALASMDQRQEQSMNRLSDVQSYARSIAALRAAPLLVEQITEDVLAQTIAAHSSLLRNPLTREWQQRIYPVCQQLVANRYPFHEGPDADLADFTDMLGPNGRLRLFVQATRDKHLDTDAEIWRWKPEARLSGVSQESAAFLQRAFAISEGFFGAAGTLDTSFSVAALAEKGQASILVGGQGAPVRASGSEIELSWPGENRQAGAEVSFRQGALSSRVIREGSWGLFRILDETRIRFREDGRRSLVDLRENGGRIFFQMVFDTPLNPVSVRPLMKGLTCPPVL